MIGYKPRDETLNFIYTQMFACQSDIVEIEGRWGTFKKAWAKCDVPQYYAWILDILADRNDYYRRAIISVPSQLLYERYRDQHDEVEVFTELLDKIAEGDDSKAAEARRIGKRIDKKLNEDMFDDPYGETKPALCEEYTAAACSLTYKKAVNHFDLINSFDISDRKERARICQLIRAMVERPEMEDLEKCKG